MGYVLTDKQKGGKRLRDPKTGKCFPFFQYPSQAMQYIKKYLGNSPYAQIHQVKKKEAKE